MAEPEADGDDEYEMGMAAPGAGGDYRSAAWGYARCEPSRSPVVRARLCGPWVLPPVASRIVRRARGESVRVRGGLGDGPGTGLCNLQFQGAGFGGRARE